MADIALCRWGEGVIEYDEISKWLHENRKEMYLLREEMNPEFAEQDLAFMRNL